MFYVNWFKEIFLYSIFQLMNKTKRNKKRLSVLPVPTLRRLPLYLSFLKSLKNKENKFISTPEIAKELHIDSSQIIKDFSYIYAKGKTKVGYETDELIKVIVDFLGYHDSNKAFIVGVGNLGLALMKYSEFREEGLEVLAGFDIDIEKNGKEINNIKIFNIDKFKEVFDKTPAEIGIITVPADHAQLVADIMIECGIKAIWNFSATPISAPDDIIVVNTSIDSGLAMIKWKLNNYKPLIYKNRML